MDTDDDRPDDVAPLPRVRLLGPADFAVALVAGAFAFGLYWLTLAPTVYGEDSGELIAAAYTLGIPHPAGYPLWCILAKVFIELVPVGEVAWRANLMSAAFGAGAVAVTALTIGLLTRSRVGALAGSLALACSLEFWEQSVIAEVYTLNAFVTALCILLLLVWGETRHNTWLYAAGLVFGLGLCNHHVLALALPAFVLYAVGIGGLRWGAWKMHLVTGLYTLLGLSVYLYLPIRSTFNPPMDWGNPQSLSGFYDVVTRGQYSFLFWEHERTWSRFLGQCWTFLRIYAEQFTPGFGWLAPFGAAVLWIQRRRAASAMLGIAFLLTVIGAIVIPNFELDRMSVWINTTYWIPAYLIAAICIGSAIAAVCRAVPHASVRALVALLLTVAAAACPLLAHYTRNDKSDYRIVEDYARNILATLAPGAIYFGDSDMALFPVMYCQIVEGARPDVLIANPYGYPIEAAYRAMPDDVKATFAVRPTVEDEKKIFSWLVHHSGRPVYSSVQRTGPDIHSVNAGLLYRYVPRGQPARREDPWPNYSWHTLDERIAEHDWSAEIILFEYYFALGRMHLDNGEYDQGVAAFERAARLACENKDGLNNLGATAARYGLQAEAIHYLTLSAALDPRWPLPRLNRARAHLRVGETDSALEQIEEVLRFEPGNETALRLRARLTQGKAGDARPGPRGP
ncbi:MAG: hypothetical protein AMXMBFR4_03330 [Candidatus Hydrogenedentota bacterium]